MFVLLKRILCICLLGLWGSLTMAHAQNAPSPQKARDVIHQLESASPTRALIDCDGQWEFSENGSDWTTIAVPSALTREGRFILKKNFSLTGQQVNGYVWKFVALGVNYQCDIFVNDQFVTHHVGGYTTCETVIPSYMLREGENTIRLDGNNVLSARETSPIITGSFAPKNYGGVYRDIALVGLPMIWLNDIEVLSTVESDRSSDVSLLVSINAGKLTHAAIPDSLLHLHPESQIPITVRAEIYEANGTTPVATTQDYTTSVGDFRAQQVRLAAAIPSPHLWTCSAPFLYKARCIIMQNGTVIDEWTTQFGIRSFTCDGDRFLLNGEPCEIKGVVYEEDHQSEQSTLAYFLYDQDLQLIKTLGANAIRLTHPANPMLLRLCDEYGILVFEQIASCNVPAGILNSTNYISLAKNDIKAMIARDRNHPCVAAWGVASFMDVVRATTYLDQVTAFAKPLDSRPLYCTTWDETAPCEGVNFCFLNEFGKTADQFQTDIHAWKAKHPSLPVVAASYGKFIKPDNHNGYNDPLAVESQAKYLLACYNALQQEHAAGGFIMSFADWYADRPSTMTAETNPYVNYTGLVSYARDERRLSFDVAKALFTGDNIPTIVIGEDPENPPIIYIIVGLIFLLMLVYLANNSRRFRENFSRAVFRPFNFYADIRDQRILSTIQTTILGVITAGTYAIFLSSVFYYIRMSVLFDNVLDMIIPSNALKYQIALMVWNPVESVIILTLVFFTILVLITAVIRFSAIFVRPRIFFSDAYSIVLWAGLPSVILIPLSMILYRVMIFPPYVMTTSVLAGAIVLWILFRILRGTAVVFDLPFRRVYTVAIALLLAMAAVVIYIYDTNYGMLAQVSMVWHQLLS
ncbi:MAG TPA: glycoside hydrolase family 2 TIM barrel-domain containing protein [Candidatus Kapabacteria bacterium]|nr:glycoside hydrolase family 2 TIM barrel-domain containing protein [Candidatus Kapabacteria bacterium]